MQRACKGQNSVRRCCVTDPKIIQTRKSKRGAAVFCIGSVVERGEVLGNGKRKGLGGGEVILSAPAVAIVLCLSPCLSPPLLPPGFLPPIPLFLSCPIPLPYFPLPSFFVPLLPFFFSLLHFLLLPSSFPILFPCSLLNALLPPPIPFPVAFIPFFHLPFFHDNDS